MVTLKALSTILLSGQVVHGGVVFNCEDGLATSLVDRGFATPLKEAEGLDDVVQDFTQVGYTPSVEDDQVERMREDYQRLTVPELVELARANGIDTTSLTRKSEYIDALVRYELGE